MQNNLVPLADGGHVPLRTSKNPVLGVYRHHCGSIATVHKPNGNKKAHLRYLICDECGTDQCAGKPYQEKIKENTYRCIEELEAAEVAAEMAASAEQETEVDLTEQTTELAVSEDPEQTETSSDELVITDQGVIAEITKPIETAEDKVSDDNVTDELSVPPSVNEPTEDTSEIAVSDSKSLEQKSNSEPKPAVEGDLVDDEAESKTMSKPKRVGIAAAVGAVIGCVFGLLA